MSHPGETKGFEVCTYDIADIEEGMSVHYTVLLSREAVNAFAELSGDISPLHVDEGFGRSSLFGGNLVHGMLIVSHFSSLVGVFLPGRNALLAGMDVSFVKPVPVGSEITVSAAVRSVQKGSRMIGLKLLAFLDGEVCVEGSAKVKVLPPQSA